MTRRATERRSDGATKGRRGFSLVEVLLAIFILGIGVIAVAALFPAGIAQQRRSVDDIIGPIVANNALAVLRTRLRAEDFGTFEEFGSATPLRTHGDWPWMRPGFFFVDTPFTPPDGGGDVALAGSISIFDSSSLSPHAWDRIPGITPIPGIPWNPENYNPSTDNPIIFNQAERYYPMQSQETSARHPSQYVWDCMFRRYQGRILVAIFVYRVAVPGGGAVVYTVPRNPSSPTVPPLPINLPVTVSWNAEIMGNGVNESIIAGTPLNLAYDPSDDAQAWQEPRQWILDQNNNVHRVLSRSSSDVDGNGAMDIELVRPLAAMPGLPTNYFPPGVLDFDGDGFADTDLISNIWYLPAEIDQPNGTYLLTPVYVTVREL